MAAVASLLAVAAAAGVAGADAACALSLTKQLSAYAPAPLSHRHRRSGLCLLGANFPTAHAAPAPLGRSIASASPAAAAWHGLADSGLRPVPLPRVAWPR